MITCYAFGWVPPFARGVVRDLRVRWAPGSCSAADILMASVLKILRHTDLLAEQPQLAAYVARCEARPAYERALDG